MTSTTGGVSRRAPFSANPTVGPRGQRTRARILDAALLVLREGGYPRCSVEQITQRAGCSRVSFYQYFSGKAELFHALAGQVAEQLRTSVTAMGILDENPAGWAELRAWMARSGAVFERYGPVFTTFEAAAASTPALEGLRTAATEHMASMRARLTTNRAELALPFDELDAVLATFVGCQVRTFHLAAVLRSRAPAAYPAIRIEDALTDVFHRTLFGVRPGVNVRPHGHEPAPVVSFEAATSELLTEGPDPASRVGGTSATLERLLAVGRDVFVERGYHGARVDDIVAAAGLSHGAFYCYFKNKEEFAHVIVLSAMRPLADALGGLPPPDSSAAGAAALRTWLRRYNARHVHEAAIIRFWVDAANPGAALGSDAAPAIDWGRRQLAHYLAPVAPGDVDADALVMVGLVDAFASHPRAQSTVDAVAHIIRRGLLGQ